MKTDELKPCPFCGIILEKEPCFGMEVVIHPVGDCALSKQLFRLEVWNQRSAK